MPTFRRPPDLFLHADDRMFQVDSLDVHQDVKSIDTHEPDPQWRGVDEAGHAHRWIEFHGEMIVTGAHEEFETYWCVDCRDEHDHAWLECNLCNEVLWPKYRSCTVWLRGPIEMKLTVRTWDQDPGEEGVVDVPFQGRWHFVRTSIRGTAFSGSKGGTLIVSEYQATGPVESAA